MTKSKSSNIWNQKKTAALLSKIFKRDIFLYSQREKAINTNEFYFVLSSDKSIKFILPKKDGCHLLSYLSPTTSTSKVILAALKVLYRLRILGLMPNISSCAVNGLSYVDWSKYGWTRALAPKVFIVIGTEKESQNAVLFLDDSVNVKNTLVVKISINNVCNLTNEYNTGNVIGANRTQYITFSPEENFLTQKYSPGFRKIIDLNDTHVDYLSGSLLLKQQKLGRDVKRSLISSLDAIDRDQIYAFPVVQKLLESVSNTSLFYSAHTHGDFAPYNIIYEQNSQKFVVIDWENANLDGLALSDLFNYVYIKDCLFSKHKSSNLDSFLYLMSQRYFSYIDTQIDLGAFYEYKVVIIINEFLLRLKDAGPDDVYVKYLYKVMKNESEKQHLEPSQTF